MPAESEGLLGALGRIASTFVGGAPNGHQFVWNAVAPWFNQLSRSATTHWLPNLVHGIPCEVIHRDAGGMGIPCQGSAVASCVVCHKPCCLDHSFVCKTGEAICYPCAQAAAAGQVTQNPAASAGPVPPPHARAAPRRPGERPRAAPPPAPKPADDPALLAAARKRLGVKPRASFDEIHAAYRKLVYVWHPDRNPQNPDAERELKEIQRAYDLLKTHKDTRP